jgi:hypothetical protein
MAGSRTPAAHRIGRAVLLAMAGLVAAPSASLVEAGESASRFQYRGFDYPSYWHGLYTDPDSLESLDALVRTGANAVAIVPTQYTSTVRSADFHATERTESDDAVAAAIRDAHARGLAVLLNPHVDPIAGGNQTEYAPDDAKLWFRGYSRLILGYAKLAADNHVELFSIGCELDTLAGPAYRAEWTGLVAAVRAVYKGPVVYASDWLGAKDVSFWDQVDYIGIDAYNPLSQKPQPSIDDLVAGWTHVSPDRAIAAKANGLSPLDFYRGLSTRYRKPVLLTEIGYRSVAGTGRMPGDWQMPGAADERAQADAFQAFFDVWSREASWVKGAFIWDWEPTPHPDLPKDYTPQGKEAQRVITEWYGGSRAAAR